MIGRILQQMQGAAVGFLRRVHGVTLRDKLRNCEIRKALNVEPLLRIEVSATLARPCVHKIPEKTDEASPVGNIHGRAAQRSPKAPGA